MCAEIRDMIKDHERVLLVGCGTCVTVCLAGGEREVGILGSALRMSLRLIGRGSVVVDQCTIERQCEDAFIDALAPRVAEYDAICSLGCGAGVQALAERFPQDARLSRPEHPVHRHSRIARRVDREVRRLRQLPAGRVCRHLPDHPLRQAPVQRPLRRIAGRPLRGQPGLGLRLAVDLRSGPSRRTIQAPIDSIALPQDWSTGLDGGPRKVVREDQCIAGLGPKA